MSDEVEDVAPKTKEQMRYEPHEYLDASGWCAVCGRSEGWMAHPVKEDELVVSKVPPTMSEDAGEPETQDSLNTEPLEPPDEFLP